MALNCEGCKAYCCRIIGKLVPELDDGSGSCLFLKDNRCQIYDNRPLICNTDRLWEKYYSSMYSKEEWIELNNKSCKELKNEYEKEHPECKDEVQVNEEMERIQGQDKAQAGERPYNGAEINQISEPSP